MFGHVINFVTDTVALFGYLPLEAAESILNTVPTIMSLAKHNYQEFPLSGNTYILSIFFFFISDFLIVQFEL